VNVMDIEIVRKQVLSDVLVPVLIVLLNVLLWKPVVRVKFYVGMDIVFLM